MSINQTMEEKFAVPEVRVTKVEAVLFQPEGVVPTAIKSKKIFPREFLLTKNLTTETQKVLALGHYLETVEGMTSFNSADLEIIFRTAKEKVPKNVNDAVNKNIVRGFIDKAAEKKDSKKAWYLTSSGENFVNDNLKK